MKVALPAWCNPLPYYEGGHAVPCFLHPRLAGALLFYYFSISMTIRTSPTSRTCHEYKYIIVGRDADQVQRNPMNL